MNAFDDPRNPYRFYTNDFGTLIDSKGEFDNNDVDDYWYDKKGNKITGYEYQNLKESKKKNCLTFGFGHTFIRIFWSQKYFK